MDRLIGIRLDPTGITIEQKVYPLEQLQEIRLGHQLLWIKAHKQTAKAYIIEESDKAPIHQTLKNYIEEFGIRFRER